MPKLKRKLKEENVHDMVCRYLDVQYPNVLYITDLSGIKLTIGQAVKAKKQRCKTFKIPDLIILEPKCDYHGLVIEIKKTVKDVFKKDGTLRETEHIQSQNKSLEHLLSRNYKSHFGCGFEDCKDLIDEYMKSNC